MLSDVDAAWLAGLLEGEGCFSVSKPMNGRRPKLEVQLKMTDADVVVKAQKLMSAPSVRLRRDTRSDKNSDCYVTRVYGQRAENVMREVLPYMGQRRTQKIQTILNMEGLSHR